MLGLSFLYIHPSFLYTFSLKYDPTRLVFLTFESNFSIYWIKSDGFRCFFVSPLLKELVCHRDWPTSHSDCFKTSFLDDLNCMLIQSGLFTSLHIESEQKCQNLTHLKYTDVSKLYSFKVHRRVET